ncbi:hypothetical protein [Haloquadratum walsbyi]|jgi:hypothetical protein|uniref:hypothetical protein n=1 Tax=Haloquadratum walsbyi TaxID=293091 RepID=UPI00069154BE|nr:hypothetical protein [Haloquadratum walsbyi]
MNLDHVIEHVHDLIPELPSKTIVTSDHGNMLGERTVSGRRIYGHLGGVRTPALIGVSLAVVQHGKRKTINDGGIHSSVSIDYDIIDQRLAALSYLDY